MMCNCSLQCCLRGGGDGYGVSWIGNLGDTQNPYKMLLVDIQCLIVHITGQLFECKRLGVINTILGSNSQTTVEKVALNSLKEISTWPSAELLNSPRGTADLHGVYGC